MSSSLVRSLASLHPGKQLIPCSCTARLGCGDPRRPRRRAYRLWTGGRRSWPPAARGANEDLSPWSRETSSSNGGAADARQLAALRKRQGQERAPPFFTWARLAAGSIVAVTAPFMPSKWASFLRIQNEVETVKDVAEIAAEVVEDVAAAAEKVSAEVAEQLPEDGRLRRAAALVERASREVAEEAHLARDIIHKVDEIEEEVKAMIEPIVDHGKHNSNHKRE